MEPINTSSPLDAIRQYMALGWPIALGHRFRPRQGCTCTRPDCPVPGAHPQPGPSRWLTPETAPTAVQESPGAGVLAGTLHFDVVTAPRFAAMAVLAALDRVCPVPCIIRKETAALLVLPATGRYAAVNPEIEVHTGPTGWIALPPSHGTVWDVPPWIEDTLAPRPLLSGEEIGRRLSAVFGFVGGPALQPQGAVR